MEVSGRRVVGSDDHSTGVLCDPCRGENEEENAVFYCTVCNEYLCDVCGKSHRRAKLSKGHLLLDRDRMPRQKLRSSEDSTCLKHRGKPVEYYCIVHDKCCCSVCATLDHKQCTVQYIDDIATEYEKSNEYTSLVKAIVDLTQLLQTTKDVSMKNKKDIQRIHDDIMSNIKRFRSEINAILDSLETASLKEAQRINDLDSQAVDSVTTTCDTILADIHEMFSNMENQEKYKQQRQLVICSKAAATQIKVYGNTVDELSKQNIVRDYIFHPNETIRQSLQSLESLGQIEERKRREDTKQLCRQVMGADVLVSSPSQTITASYVGNIDIKHSTDTEDCWITGGVMIHQDTLAVVDYCNSSVKVVDVNNNTVISCIKLSTKPWDITCVNKDQVVVTCIDGKLVFLNVSRTTLSVMKELNIDGHCMGIVYTNNTFIVSFCYPEPSVKIINMSGNILKTFNTDESGNNLFTHPWYIALSTDQNTVFVSDWDNNNITSLTLDGTVHHVYRDDNLDGPRGLTVDENGNVYIADWVSHTIHRKSTEGKLSQVLLDTPHEVEHPQMMTYCKTTHRLYISHDGPKGYVISVVQLQ